MPVLAARNQRRPIIGARVFVNRRPATHRLAAEFRKTVPVADRPVCVADAWACGLDPGPRRHGGRSSLASPGSASGDGRVPGAAFPEVSAFAAAPARTLYGGKAGAQITGRRLGRVPDCLVRRECEGKVFTVSERSEIS